MELFFSQFHLLRPAWLFALIPAIILFSFLLKRRLASARWNGIIDKTLMPHVLDQMPSEQSRWPLWFILFAWVIASIALAGPTWQQLPQPVQKKDDALVIALDMSLSMAAQDVSPDRATRAQQKVIDILKQRKEGLTALVAYAGDAYTVTPLTDDTETAINLIPALSPFIMPAMGSRPDKALTLAKKLINDAGLSKANYLLVTDGIQKKDISRIKSALGNQQQQLSVLTLGTEEGAPIAMQGQGFKRDADGNIVLPKLDLNLIKSLSSDLGIRWHQMSFDDRDWHYLLNIDSAFNNLDATSQNHSNNNTDINNKALERQFDLWADQGYWLIFIIVIIAAFSFRRGWMLSLVFLITLQPENSYADIWEDAWKTKDQQGQEIFKQDPAKAAEIFEDPNWKASSYYRAEDYEKAAEIFTTDQDAPPKKQAEIIFNRANALAKSGKLEESIKAYEQALELNAEFDDAQFNKDLIEKLLEQQEQEEQEQQDKDDSEDQENKDSKDDSKNDSSKNEQSDSDESNDSNSDSQNDSEENNSEQSDSDQQKEQDSKESQQDEKESDEEQSKNQQSDQQNTEEQTSQEKEQQNSAANPTDELSEEEKQALEQWLNRIPDDPGGLLKRKFLYQYKQREHQDEGEVSW